MDKWGLYPSGGDSGILKKQLAKEPETNNLLVFGYSCKIFRDDAKAWYLDQGKHLIQHPIEDIKIDRYDARGALNDLAQYEPPPGGYTNRLDYLSAAEQRAEQLCEEERYYSLYNNEVEEELYFEESMKRQTVTHGQIAFNYDNVDTNSPATEIGAIKNDEITEAETEEDLEPFVAPHNFDIPIDMEVPDTMKLHNIIEKTARFIAGQGAQMEILLKAKQANNRQFDFLNQDCKYFNYYRHVLSAMKNNCYPVLEEPVEPKESKKKKGKSGDGEGNASHSAVVEKPVVVVPQIRYKPSKDCSYTQLISKITGAPIPVQPPSPPVSEQSATNQTATLVPADPKIELKQVSHGLLGLVQNYNSGSESDNDDDQQPPINGNVSQQLLQFDGVHPPDYLKNVIDKTAGYVAKNGKDFEEILRTKRADFEFLNVTDEFHPYYLFKVKQVINPYVVASLVPTTPVVSTKPPLMALVPPAPLIGGKLSALEKRSLPPPGLVKPKIMAPVSFSIKPKDEPPVASKAVLPQDDGNHIQKAANSRLNGENGHNSRQLVAKVEVPPPSSLPTTTLDIDSAEEDDSDGNLDKYNLDLDLMIDINDDLLERKVQAKRAEEKLRDRIAAAAREKLGLISKEKQLQMERKKKAMAFLNNIKGAASEQMLKPSVGDGDDDEKGHDSDIASIHSIPSSIDEVEEIFEAVVQKRSRGRSRSYSRLRSRSRSRSTTSSRHKHKKSKSSHSKKKSKRKSRSRSRSQSRTSKRRSRSRSRSSRKKKKYRN